MRCARRGGVGVVFLAVLAVGSSLGQSGEPTKVVISDPPVASLILISEADGTGRATVTGGPGAVKDSAVVGVAFLDTACVRFVQAESEVLSAPPRSLRRARRARERLAPSGGVVP